jgi:hypothetical protein
MSDQEVRQFQMHPKLLFDVIQRQAGTLGKAVLEGVMNSIDAKATKCEITLDENHLEIADDGQGFRNRGEIESWFEVFGQPHDETEDKTYGTFRMGRGQLFAFGANAWHTGKFHMGVDVKAKGLDYTLTENGDAFKGCSIKVVLYHKLTRVRFAETVREIELLCKYTPIPVYLNGEQINTDPETEKWDHVTDDAYIRIRKTGSIAVYHLGVYIKEMSGYHYGVGGTIVAKKQLMLNFARNDVMTQDCPVWKRVSPFFKTQADSQVKKTALNDQSRQKIANELRFGEIDPTSIFRTKLFTAATGRQFSLYDINNTWDFRQTYSVARRGDRIADRVMQVKSALIIAQETLDRFEAKNIQEFWQQMIGWANEATVHHRLSEWRYVEFGVLAENYSLETYHLQPKELKPLEQIWLKIIDHGMNHFACVAGGWRHRRKALIGIGNAQGWTDGMTYIAINRDYLAGLEFNALGIAKLGNLILHEYCHDENDTGTHLHTQEFYEKYHDKSDEVARFTHKVMGSLESFFLAAGRKMKKKLLSQQDYQDKLKRKVAELKVIQEITEPPKLTRANPKKGEK